MTDVTMDISSKHYKIDSHIKNMLKEKYGFDDKEAEGIALAIDMKEQDISRFATKSDIKDLKLEMYKVQIGTIAIMLGVLGRWLGKW